MILIILSPVTCDFLKQIRCVHKKTKSLKWIEKKMREKPEYAELPEVQELKQIIDILDKEEFVRGLRFVMNHLKASFSPA